MCQRLPAPLSDRAPPRHQALPWEPRPQRLQTATSSRTMGFMHVALFGGSFDPPHVGHQMACLYVLETEPVDEVWMMPVFRHAFDKRSAPYPHRLALCERAAAALGPRVRVSAVESELEAPNYTLLTVKALQARHPEHRFSMVIGADLLKERERWYGWPELEQLLPFIVLGRSGAEAGDEDERLDLPAVSSTKVRARLAAGERPSRWVARSVLDYIEAQGLYRAAAPAPQETSP